MSYLVDANVISEAVRRSPDAHVLNWLGVHDAELFVSTLTLGEVEKGIVKLPNGSRRRQLEEWLNEVRAAMAGRILAFGEAEASAWAHHFEKQRTLGRLLPSIDSMIAATAIVHDLAVVSRNVADFPGVKVVNPWIKET